MDVADDLVRALHQFDADDGGRNARGEEAFYHHVAAKFYRVDFFFVLFQPGSVCLNMPGEHRGRR